jgi:hypothetical protein
VVRGAGFKNEGILVFFVPTKQISEKIIVPYAQAATRLYLPLVGFSEGLSHQPHSAASLRDERLMNCFAKI